MVQELKDNIVRFTAENEVFLNKEHAMHEYEYCI